MSSDDMATKAGVTLYRHLVGSIQDQIKYATSSYHAAAVQFAQDQKPESRVMFLKSEEYIRGLEQAKKVITDNASVFSQLDRDNKGDTT